MAYEKTDWEDSPSTDTPINSTNLNHMENAIESISNKVDLTTFNPSTATFSYTPFTETSTEKRLINDGFMCITRQGSTSTIGAATQILGNSTTSGTNGNKRGALRLYGAGSGYVDIQSATSNDGVLITLPSLQGTAVVKQSTTITTETNGWYVVNMGAYTLYFKTGQIPSQTYNMNSWGLLSGTWRNLPSGISFNSAKMVFSGNAQCEDPAILYNLSIGNGGTAVGVGYNNKYGQDLTKVGYYNFSLTVFP